MSSHQRQEKERCRDHLKRTAESNRKRTFATVIVSDVKELSDTVKKITMSARDEQIADLSFKAGQWVDMVIPKVKVVGGFSICNSPGDLVANKRLILAVKKSNHPPALWCTTQCKVGDELEVRVGGDIFYEHLCDEDRPLLLIGGGVGVNPLLSIFLHKSDINITSSSDSSTTTEPPKPTHFMLTAKSQKDLLFETEISSACAADHSFTCQFHITQQQQQSTNDGYKYRRLTKADIQEAVDRLTTATTTSLLPNCYICGPPPFIEWCEEQVVEAGVERGRVRYEKWW